MDEKTKEFIEKARKVHGDRYDYSKTKYKGYNYKVEVVCRECGPYWVDVGNHLAGNNCPNCRIVTTEKFIKKSKELYGEDRFDYSFTKYTGVRGKVDLICNKEGHGRFSQLAQNHLKKPEQEPCPDCRVEKRKKRQEEFIKESKRIHGENRYDYSEVCFESAKKDSKVIIKCNECGNRWKQYIYSHLNGFSCPKCSQYNRESFIKKSKELHGDVYGYDKFVYTGLRDKAIFWCKQHEGYFEQRPSVHLQSGCPVCSRAKYTTEEWVKRAKEVNGGRYDYSRVDYKRYDVEVDLFCNLHMEWFKQKPSDHLAGKTRCSGCIRENRKRSAWGRLGVYRLTEKSGTYLLKLSTCDSSWLKVGLSNNLKRRIYDLERDIDGVQVEVVAYFEGPARECFELENGILHRCGIPKLINQDWNWAGKSECFAIEHLDDILRAMNERADYLTGVFRTQ